MKPVPRLLPLVAVAIGGVLAVKALAGVQALPALLSGAQALAEEAPARAGRHSTPGQPKAASPLPPTMTPSAANKPAAPICAQSPADLAREAGLSPGELATLQNLGARRGQLDDRERALDTQLQLLAAAETKVDGRMKALDALKAEIQGLLGQADQQKQAEVDRLVVVYEKMKPRDAAAIMATLDDRVRIPVAAKMKPAKLADILAQMPTPEAKKVTEELAGKLSPQALSEADPPPGLPPGQGSPGQAGAVAGPAPAPAAATAQANPAPKPAEAASALAAAASEPHAQAPRRLRARKRTLARARADTPTQAAARAETPKPAPAKPPVETATAASRPAAAPAKPTLPAPTSASTAG